MDRPRIIAVVTTSRADFGHLVWPLRAMQQHHDLDPRLLVLGAHLSPEFGRTVDAIEAEGFEVAERIECLLSSDSDVGMAKTIGLATLSLADTLSRLRPDLLLVIADRYEMLAPASVALALRIPLAHVEGGEVSEGAIDDAVRNALTKLSHVHFAPHQPAADRIRNMGEEDWRIHVTGAPSLDHLRHSRLTPAREIRARLGLPEDGPLTVVAYHPVTLSRDTTAECDAVFAALEERPGAIAFCFPNADAGSRAIIQRAERFCGAPGHRRLFVNLAHLDYWSLLGAADLMVGNSSSGIMETPSLALPTVDIGWRQRGRVKARNILQAPAETQAIVQAMGQAAEPSFRSGLTGLTNPYGDGHAGERIASVLASAPLGETLLTKRATDP